MEMMQKEPKMFYEYHEGFRQQAAQWPTNPVETFIRLLMSPKITKAMKVADMGCGDAQLAQKLEEREDQLVEVSSFDLVKTNKYYSHPCSVQKC